MFWHCRPATLTPSPARRWLSQRRFRWPLEVATASEALLDHVRRSTYSSLLPQHPRPTTKKRILGEVCVLINTISRESAQTLAACPPRPDAPRSQRSGNRGPAGPARTGLNLPFLSNRPDCLEKLRCWIVLRYWEQRRSPREEALDRKHPRRVRRVHRPSRPLR